MKQEITIERIKGYLWNMAYHYKGSHAFADISPWKNGDHPCFPAAIVRLAAVEIILTVKTVQEFSDALFAQYEALSLNETEKEELGIRAEQYLEEIRGHYEDLINFSDGELAEVFCQY